MKFFSLEMSDMCADKKKKTKFEFDPVLDPEYQVKKDTCIVKPLPGRITKEQLEKLGIK